MKDQLMKFVVEVTRVFSQTVTFDADPWNSDEINTKLAEAKIDLVWNYSEMVLEEEDNVLHVDQEGL